MVLLGIFEGKKKLLIFIKIYLLLFIRRIIITIVWDVKVSTDNSKPERKTGTQRHRPKSKQYGYGWMVAEVED